MINQSRAAEISAPKIPGGISVHELEMLKTLMRKGRASAAAVYLGGIRSCMDRATATAGDRRTISKDTLRQHLQGEASVSEALSHLRQARLIQHLPGPPGQFRFFLPLVDRDGRR